MALVPIKYKGEIIHAIVDDEDYETVSELRWVLLVVKRKLRVSRYVVHRWQKNKTVRCLYMHRLIMNVEDSRIEIDHRNGNELDNRKANLRISTHAENLQNRQGGGYGKSKYRGVRWDKRGKWRAEATINGKYHYIGFFSDEDEAGSAAKEFRRKHMPTSERDK